MELIDLIGIIEDGTENDWVHEVSLLAHRQCISHTLNLAATNNVKPNLYNLDHKSREDLNGLTNFIFMFR